MSDRQSKSSNRRCDVNVQAISLVCLMALSGCTDQSSAPDDDYDELAPYYSGEVVADYPAEMAEYRETFDASGLPFATAEGDVGRTSVYDSKLLGTPYMPKGFDYPRDPAGRPLRLLAQINFADVPPLPDYPDSGILQFYISDDEEFGGQVWGLQFYLEEPFDPHGWFELMQSQDYFRIVWHETILTDEDALEHEVPAAPRGLMPVDDEVPSRDPAQQRTEPRPADPLRTSGRSPVGTATSCCGCAPWYD